MEEQWNPGIRENWAQMTTDEIRADAVAMVASQNGIDEQVSATLVEEWIASAMPLFQDDLDRATRKAHQMARSQGITPPPTWDELGPQAQAFINALEKFAL